MFGDEWPLIAGEDRNQHGHSRSYDGGCIGLHVPNFSGGSAFACYHPSPPSRRRRGH